MKRTRFGSRAAVLCLWAAALPAARPVSAADEESQTELRQEVQDLKKRIEILEHQGQAAPSAGNNPAPQSAPAAPAKPDPFSFADFTWLTGNSRVSKPMIDNEYFTGQFMLDVQYVRDFNMPADHTLNGAAEIGRVNEFQVQQLGVGGDLHYDHIRGRVMTQFGLYSQLTPRNDPSPGRGQFNIGDAYKYLSEAYGGYHWDKMYGINLDAGIFMSYIGLFSYYQNENWAYMPSYVSANTPWFFNGVRLQLFPTEKLKIEPWLVNGWQSYGVFNEDPGVGMQILWRPTGNLSLLSNNYWGHDALGVPRRQRYHTDNSIQVKYYEDMHRLLDRAAFSVTADAGCEEGGGVSCTGTANRPKQAFLGYMVYNRAWFDNDLFGLTLGGGEIDNPGRYLVLLPPVNGATAFSGTPYFTESPGDQFKAWDMSVTFDYMPSQYITWRLEYNHRQSNVPYFAGRGGETPPGGNQGPPGSFVPGFAPDLRRSENRATAAMLIRL